MQPKNITLLTHEKSLISLHEKILNLLDQQSPEARSLIQQIIDYYSKIILCMPGNVYWIDEGCTTIGCNQNVLDMFGLKSYEDFYNLSFDEMAEIGHWSANQGASFERDTREVIESGKAKKLLDKFIEVSNNL